MTSFITWRASDVEKAILGLLQQMLPNTKMQDFEKKRDIREINPPRDGIAYACEYLLDMRGVHLGVASGDIKIEQYWNKDGNCIGFMFQGQQYMFDKEKLPEQARDTIVQAFRDGQSRILSKVPENSELAKYLEQYPDAILTQGSGGWSTELPKDLYPDLWSFQRIQMWNKDGKPGPALKGMQKEM